MKNTNIIIAFLLGLLALTACHKDKEFDVKDAVVSNKEVTVSGTQVRFTWSVDFAGKFQTGVEISQNENMAEAKRVEATKDGDKFVAIADSLSSGKKYYYRIVVWNKFGDVGQPVGDFTTSMSYTILVSADGGGRVTGGGTYIAGDTCTVVASADLNYNFVNWTENGSQVSTEAEYSFAVASDRNLVAHFTSQEFTITTTAEPEEGGTVDGSGGYNNGDECTLTATANEGYTFINWTKDGTEVSTNPVYTFTVTETATYLANFQVQSYIITVSADQDEGGSVEGGGTYEYGQSCTVHATEANGYHFVNWTENGEQVSSDEEYTFTVTRDRDLVAHFTSQDYIIHVDIDPENSGTVTGNHGYNYDEECTLKAIPAEGFSFVKWTEGNNDILDNPYIFRVTESRNFVAHFQAINYQISVSAEPSGGGTVTGGGNGFHYGDECEVTATANTNYVFANWTENGSMVSEEISYTFQVTHDRTLVANFRHNYTIEVSANPPEGGTATGGGTYSQDDTCTVVATANEGYRFDNWTENGNVVQGANANYRFPVTGDRILVANFSVLPPNTYNINVSANPTNGGTVIGGGTYNQNEQCTVEATANANYVFTNWTENGSVVSTQANYTFTVTDNRTLVANFTYIPSTYMISVSANPSNGGTVTGGGTYNEGQQCTVHANPNGNYTFTNWTENGSVVSTQANYTFTVTINRTLVANFTSNSGNHAYVDLGLPSGLLWATCNVGADNPEDYGDYFAWGETEPKDIFDWSTYQYCMGDDHTLTKYCDDAYFGYNGFTDNLITLLPEDDAATVNWGSSWRMPIQAEWHELLNNTTVTWTTQNSVSGILFTATNGNSLFLPAAGYRSNSGLYDVSSHGNYWSISLNTNNIPSRARCLYFFSDDFRINVSSRDFGYSVRPVREN